MAVENDVLFSIFDDKKGPLVFYSTLDSEEAARTIAVKSFITIGSMEEKSNLNHKQAILPFPNLKKIAFFHMFQINRKDMDLDKKNTCWVTLSYLEDINESENFYQKIPLLEKECFKTAKMIQKSFQYSNQNFELDQRIIDSFDTLKRFKADSRSTTETLRFEDIRHEDLMFLIEYFSADLAPIIYSLMLEEPLIIISDIKEIVDRVVNSLNILVPHRLLSHEYIIQYTDPSARDLLICSSHVNFLNKYSNITQIHVDKRKVISRKKNLSSVENLIKTLKIAPQELQTKIYHKFLDKLLHKVTILIELCEREQVTREEISNFRKDLQSDELNIVISIVRNYAPYFQDKLFHFARGV